MDYLRIKTINFMQKYGTPLAFLAKKIGCSRTHLALYLKQERELSEPLQNLLRGIVEG